MGKKGTNWRNAGKRDHLNLYLDILPNVQFLFVRISTDDGTLDINFYLPNTNNINSSLFEMLESHYQDLNLFSRFKENCDTTVSELEYQIKIDLQKLPLEQIKEGIIEHCNEYFALFGRNHWKLILKLALVNDSNYMDRFYE